MHCVQLWLPGLLSGRESNAVEPFKKNSQSMPIGTQLRALLVLQVRVLLVPSLLWKKWAYVCQAKLKLIAGAWQSPITTLLSLVFSRFPFTSTPSPSVSVLPLCLSLLSLSPSHGLLSTALSFPVQVCVWYPEPVFECRKEMPCEGMLPLHRLLHLISFSIETTQSFPLRFLFLYLEIDR